VGDIDIVRDIIATITTRQVWYLLGIRCGEFVSRQAQQQPEWSAGCGWQANAVERQALGMFSKMGTYCFIGLAKCIHSVPPRKPIIVTLTTSTIPWEMGMLRASASLK
jgi:hypothetical protein